MVLLDRVVELRLVPSKLLLLKPPKLMYAWADFNLCTKTPSHPALLPSECYKNDG